MSRYSEQLIKRLEADGMMLPQVLAGATTQIKTYPERVKSNRKYGHFEHTWELQLCTFDGGMRPRFYHHGYEYTIPIGSHIALTTLLKYKTWEYVWGDTQLTIEYTLPDHSVPW